MSASLFHKKHSDSVVTNLKNGFSRKIGFREEVSRVFVGCMVDNIVGSSRTHNVENPDVGTTDLTPPLSWRIVGITPHHVADTFLNNWMDNYWSLNEKNRPSIGVVMVRNEVTLWIGVWLSDFTSYTLALKIKGLKDRYLLLKRKGTRKSTWCRNTCQIICRYHRGYASITEEGQWA